MENKKDSPGTVKETRLAGFEPVAFGFGSRCDIHFATDAHKDKTHYNIFESFVKLFLLVF